MRLAALAHVLSDDLRTAIDQARAMHLEGVVLDLDAFPALLERSRTAQREIAHVLSRAGQPPIGIDIRCDPAGFLPKGGDVEREIARVGQAIDVARGIACPLVLCDLGSLPPAPDERATPSPAITKAALGALILPEMPAAPRPTAPAIARDPAFEASVDYALRAIGVMADRAGCIVAFRASLGSFASLAAVVQRADCPFFGIDFDPVALLADTWSLDQTLSRLGSQLTHVRARDGRRGTTGRVMASEIGAGQIDWPALLAALQDSDYRGDLTIDPTELPTRRGTVARAASTLRQLLQRDA